MEHKFSKIRTPHTAHRTPHTAHRTPQPMNQDHAAGKYIFLRPFCVRFSSFSFRPSCSAANRPADPAEAPPQTAVEARTQTAALTPLPNRNLRLL